MNIAITLAILYAAASAVSFIVVYWLTAQWWHNRIGKSLMIQSIVLSATFVFTAFRRLTGAHLAIPPGTAWLTLSFFTLIGTAELQRTVAFWLEARRDKRDTLEDLDQVD